MGKKHDDIFWELVTICLILCLTDRLFVQSKAKWNLAFNRRNVIDRG